MKLDEEFWKPFGEQWWRDSAATVGATNQQTIFACAKYASATNTGAARLAGYKDTGDETTGIRQIAYRVYRSNAVQNLLALAAAEGNGGRDGTVDRQEAKRLLSKLIRGPDPSIRIRGIEALNRLEENEAAERKAGDEECDPKKTLTQIAAFNPMLAEALALKEDVDWTPTKEQRALLEKQKEKIARDYLHKLANARSENGAEADQHTVITHTEARAEPANEARNAQAKQFVSSGAQV